MRVRALLRYYVKEPLLQSFTITARAIRPVADETVKLGRIWNPGN